MDNKPNINNEIVIALAGNPNTGKSTIFNALTGLRQHTGNWAGKTVTHAKGYYLHKGKKYSLIDLPGTYSLLANSNDELAARDFIFFQKPSATIVVADATNLERNLNLTLQITEVTKNVVLCVNLLDEAERKNIVINLEMLSKKLGIPVVGTVARNQKGLTKLKDTIDDIVQNKIELKPLQINYSSEIERKVEELVPQLEMIFGDQINTRWIALRLIEGDQTIIDSMQQFLTADKLDIKGEIALCH